nr:hypothetical protein [Pandoravirus massiliensis]
MRRRASVDGFAIKKYKNTYAPHTKKGSHSKKGERGIGARTHARTNREGPERKRDCAKADGAWQGPSLLCARACVAPRSTPNKGKEIRGSRLALPPPRAPAQSFVALPCMSSPVSYRPEAWAYVDQRGVRSGAAVAPSDAVAHVNAASNANGDGTYCDRRTATYIDECGRPCVAPLTPRARWSPPPPQPGSGGMAAMYDVNQTATPDMAIIIERLLDDLDREREARARAEERTTVTTTTASSFTTTPVPGAPPGSAVITQHVQTPAQQQQQQPPQQAPALPPASYAPNVFVGAAMPPAPTAPVGGANTGIGNAAPASTTAAMMGASRPPPPGTTSNRTLLLALIPVLVIALLFAAWVVWRLSGIERRLTAAIGAHASSAGAVPLVSPVVSPVATAPAAVAAAAPQPSRGMLAVDTNNQYYYARPIVP